MHPSMRDCSRLAAGEGEAEAHLSFPALPAGAESLGVTLPGWEKDKNELF